MPITTIKGDEDFKGHDTSADIQTQKEPVIVQDKITVRIRFRIHVLFPPAWCYLGRNVSIYY